MRTVPLVHIIDDIELEQKMTELDKRCKALHDNAISLECLMQAAITNFPMRTLMCALIMWADDKIFELEQIEKNIKKA